MPEIIALFTVFIPHLSVTTTRQLSQVVLTLLAMIGRITMLIYLTGLNKFVAM